MSMKYRIKTLFWLGCATLLRLIDAIVGLLFFLILLLAMILKRNCYENGVDILYIYGKFGEINEED